MKKQDKSELFLQLFHTCYERLHRYAYTLLRDSEEANDIIQTVFARLWEKRETVIFEDDIKGYLYRSVHNLSMNVIRKEGARNRYMSYKNGDKDSLMQGGTEQQTLTRELEQHISRATGALPEQCRIIFLKSREEGKKYAEIATELNISVKTVEAQMSKALRLMREKLADYLLTVIILWYINHLL
ncbi:RNA polymerase sigma-70 factor [Chitinophaga sp. S165]|uniref:RNA polymerase sigma-70 factor n=1 Tax=Chitinophaga sp. S165 TaxID=2135462 RepID=UPI000D719C34|nr:RNA polymerase sigma-70 factor [Chitinophaga sp. S165]PWV53275.1 RNA polymerase sigma-70 factor (ECF subfamily) [Chitinophaga sp. S165]